MMMRGLKYILLLIVFILISWFFLSQPNSSYSSVSVSPCEEPLTYQLSHFDERFNISEQDLLSALEDAAEAWSEVVGNTVVKHATEGDIQVNLYYSEDQEISEQERAFRNRLRSAEFEIESVQSQFNHLQSEFNQENDRYQSASRQLQQQINELNQWVNEVNARGGFNQSELQQFEAEKAHVDRQTEQLRATENRLANKADEVNAMARRLNNMIEDKNRLVDRYNRTFAGQRRFTQGTYRCDSSQCELNIYYFADMEQLRLVAAHELGHALGIGHVSNPESIMYHLMGRQSRTGIHLTREDSQALLDICE